MAERGLVSDFPVQALAKLDGIHGLATRAVDSMRDLRNLLWSSIGNDDSRDLDPLTVAEAMPALRERRIGRARQALHRRG